MPSSSSERAATKTNRAVFGPLLGRGWVDVSWKGLWTASIEGMFVSAVFTLVLMPIFGAVPAAAYWLIGVGFAA